MKKIIILTCIIAIALSLQSQEDIRTLKYIKDRNNKVEMTVSEIDSVIFNTCVLVNGVLWATCNVNAPGSFTAYPEDAGMFYQWNRRVGWSSTDPLVNHEGGTAWNNSTPTGDILIRANDPCPEGWRVPKQGELQSLLNSGSFWGELNGVSGRFFGNGDHKVFFPAAGYRNSYGATLNNVGYSGFYWSATSFGGENSYYLDFGSGYANMLNYSRSVGCSIRCVYSE